MERKAASKQLDTHRLSGKSLSEENTAKHTQPTSLLPQIVCTSSCLQSRIKWTKKKWEECFRNYFEQACVLLRLIKISSQWLPASLLQIRGHADVCAWLQAFVEKVVIFSEYHSLLPLCYVLPNYNNHIGSECYPNQIRSLWACFGPTSKKMPYMWNELMLQGFEI